MGVGVDIPCDLPCADGPSRQTAGTTLPNCTKLFYYVKEWITGKCVENLEIFRYFRNFLTFRLLY